jgi:DNA-binding NtrC family response regulator
MGFPNRPFTLAPSPLPAIESVFFYRDKSNFLAGSSAAISQVMGQIRRVAPYFRTALFTGERSCGEEAAAQALHKLSPMGHRPFVTLTAEEAEQRLGGKSEYDALAVEGMLYIPQPERLQPFAQKALLRLLRERGAQAPRLAAFAERGLRPLVSIGTFSAELAESLGALRVTLPPLRDRTEDLPELLREMLCDQADQMQMTAPPFGADLLEAGKKHAWPGNFDQLRSVSLRLLERGAKGPLHAEDLRTVLGAMPEPVRRDRREARMVSLEQVIQDHVQAVLISCNGNKLRAAEVLGISRSTLYRMLESQPATGPGVEGEAQTARHALRNLAVFKLAG